MIKADDQVRTGESSNVINLLDIQRMSSEDGPGLRTTVFLKGCPLECVWCHNPESISARGEVLWHGDRCMACASCADVCPQEGLSLGSERLILDRAGCQACFRCVDACPTAALEAKGRKVAVEELVKELLKDAAYWGEDGGVTLSGGEALLQEETMDLLASLKEAQAQTAVDTCGAVPEERLRRALEHTDIVLYDLKLADTEAHRAFARAGNEQVLRNLAVVFEWARATPGRVWIRTPVIPGATDSDENIRGIAHILDEGADMVERWELCAFNNLGSSKYAAIDRVWEYASSPLMTKQRMLDLVKVARANCGIENIRATGAMKE